MVGPSPSSLDLSGVGVRSAGDRRAPLPGELDLSGIGAPASSGFTPQVGPDGIAPAAPWAETDAADTRRASAFGMPAMDRDADTYFTPDAPSSAPPITQDAVDLAGNAALDTGWSSAARGMAAGAVLVDGPDSTDAEQAAPQDDDVTLRRAAWLLDGNGNVRPEDAARAREVSRATGFPLQDALANLDSGERILARAGLERTLRDLKDTAPRTLGLLADAEAVLHAKDDVPALSGMERGLSAALAVRAGWDSMWTTLTKGIVRAPIVIERGMEQMVGQTGGAVASLAGMLPRNDNSDALLRFGEAMERMGLAASKRTGERLDSPALSAPAASRYTAEQIWNDPALMLDPNWLAQNTTDAAAQLVPTMLAYLFGGGAAATVVGGWQEAAAFYESLRDSGMDRDRAQAASMVFGAVVGKLEAFGVQRMFAESTAETMVGRALHRLSVGASEAGSEYMENPIQGAIEGVARGESMSEILARVEAGLKDISVLPPSFLLGLFAPGAGALNRETETRRLAREQVAGQSGGGDDGGQIVEAPAALDATTRAALAQTGETMSAVARDTAEAEARVQAGQQLAAAALAADESRLRQRSPEAFAEIAARLVPEGVEQMWLDPATVETFMQSPRPQGDGGQAGEEALPAPGFGPAVLDVLGITPDVLEQARATGAPLPVDTVRVLAAGQDVRAAVLDAARLTPDGMTDAEARAFNPQARLEEGVEKVRTAQRRAADVLKEERRLRKELVAAGYPKHVAQDAVTLAVSSANAFAAQYGWDASAMLSRVSIQRGAAEQAQAAGQTFSQESIASADEALRRDSAAWAERVDAFTSGTLNPRRSVPMLTQTPLVLQMLGAKSLPVATSHGVLKKVLVEKHRLPVETLKQVPAAMADPVMVFRSATQGGDLVMMLDLKDQDGATVIVPVALEQDTPEGYRLNFVPSLYGQKSTETGLPRNQWFAHQIEAGNLLYRNNKKSRAWAAMVGLQLPPTRRPGAGTKKIFSDADLVNLRAERPGFYQSAFHGSPHRFDQFTLDAIGSGEGNQTFGWGLYFSGKREIAEWYRETLSQKEEQETENWVLRESEAKTASEAAQWVRQYLKDFDDGLTPFLLTDEERAVMERVKAFFEKGEMPDTGQLYEADIPEDDVMLHWDIHLEEQPESVRNMLESLQDEGMLRNRSGEWHNKTGKELYHQLTENLGSDSSASEHLNAVGIKGIKYLDGVSRGAGKGTYNYVIFDDSAIRTLRTYYQTANGAPRAHVQFLEDGRSIIRVFDGADLSSVVHELGHVWFANLEQVQADGMAPALERFADRAQQLAQDAALVAEGGLPQQVVDLAARVGEAAMGDNPRPALMALREELRAMAGRERQASTGTDDGGQAPPSTPAQVAMRRLDSALSSLIAHARGLEQAAADVATLREWAGVPVDGPLTPEQRTHLHEQTARGTEAYLREGNAPTPALAGVFQRISQWLRKIYASVRDLDVKLTDEVRDVFGRMLTTDAEVSQSREVQAALAGEDDFLRDLSVAVGGLDLDDAERLAELRSKAEAAVTARMDAATLRDRAARLREHRKEATRIVNDKPLWQLVDYLASQSGPGLNRDYLAELYGPQAVRSLAKRRPGLVRENGTMLDDVAQEFGWADGDAAWAEMYDTMALRRETKTSQIRELAERMMAVEDAEHTPDEMLSSGDEYGDYLEQVDATLTRLMVRERWARRRQPADAATLLRQADALRTPRARIVALAANEINATPLRDIRPDRYGAALRVALRERDEAVKRGNVAEAVNAHQRARIAAELLDMAHRTRRDAEQVQQQAQRMLAAKPEVRDGLHTEGIRRVAVNMGLVAPRAPFSRADAAMRLRDIVASGVDAEGAVDAAPSFPDWLLNEAGPDERRMPDERGRLNWKHLTPGELRDVANLLAYLDHMGRNLRGADKRSEQARIDAAAINGAQPMLALKPEAARPRDGTMRRQFADTMAKGWAEVNALQWQFGQADGFANIGPKGTAGPNETHLLRSIRDGEEAARARMKNDVAPRLVAAMDTLGQSVQRWEKQYGRNLQITGRDGKVVAVPKLLADNGRPHWTADAVLALALNMGNASNMARVRGGYPDLTHETVAQLLGDRMADRLFSVDPKTGQMMQNPTAFTYHPQTGEVLDASPVQRRPGPEARGLLTLEDWRAVQQTWDTIDSLWPDTAAVHKRMFGFEPPKIDATALAVLHDGATTEYLRGGYYPVRYDPRLSEKVGAWTEADDILNRNESVFGIPAAKRGHTKARSDGAPGLPVRLDTGVLLEHLTDAVTYIHLAETVRFADRVTQHPEWRRAYISAFGREDFMAIRNNLRGLVRRDAPADSALVRFADILRPHMVAYGLGWNFKAALLQTTALAPAMNDIGRQAVLRGLSRVASRDGLSVIRAVQEASPYMASRVTNIDQDMRKQMKELSPDRRGLRVQVGGRTITHDDVVDAGMLPIVAMDAVATTSVWLGAYEKRLGELGTDTEAAHAAMQRGGDPALAAHEDAMRYADDMVKRSNPDGDASSRSSVLRSNGAARLFNMFSSATQLIAQRQRYHKQALQKGAIGWGEYARFQAYDMAVPAVGMWLLLSVARGVFGGDDEDRKLLMKSFLASLLDIGAARLPVFGGPLAEMITGEGGARGGARVSTALDMPMQIGGRVAGAARKVAARPTEQEVLRQAGWAALALVSFVSRIPFDRVARNAVRGWDQMMEGKGTPLSLLMPRPGK